MNRGLRWPKPPKRLAKQLEGKLPKGVNRFGNRIQSCWNNGSWYQSRAEARYARDLDLRLKAKDIRSWTKQVRVDLVVNGKHITSYYVDFRVVHNDGSIEWVEVKGPETDVWRIKRRLFEAVYLPAHPNERYAVERV